MNNKLEIFENPEFGQVRVIVNNSNEPLFCLADICRILSIGNPSHLKERLDEEGIQLVDLQALSNNEGVIIKQLGNTKSNFINEPNLYRVIFQSRKEEAVKFQNWVFNEVLPSIRKTGSYSAQQKLPQTFAQALRAYADEVEKNEQLRLEVGQQKQVISELQPKATYYDLILSSIDCLTVTQIAKDYGMTAQALNQFLFEKKVQFKQSGTWLLYQNHADKGYTKSETVPITYKNGEKGSKLNTKWTQKGRLFLYQLLKNNNILPLMEREL